MNNTDNTHNLNRFNQVTSQLDSVRNEKFYDIFPELKGIQDYV